MSFGGHFESLEENSDVKNQILQTPDKIEDKKDTSDAPDEKKEKREQMNEASDDSEKNIENKKDGDAESEHKSKFDSLKEKFNAFKDKLSNKEQSEKPNEQEKVDQKVDGNDSKEKEMSFADRLKEGAPSLEEQAEMAKNLPGREEHLEAREKSEKAEADYPDLKDWELSPEQLEEANQDVSENTSEKKMDNAGEGKAEASDSDDVDEGRTPGGDAWERRFGRIEGE